MKGYRCGKSFHDSAFDIIVYESIDLCNEHVFNDACSVLEVCTWDELWAKIADLDAVWLCDTSKDAQRYGDDIESVIIPDGSIRLVDMQDEGSLWLIG